MPTIIINGKNLNDCSLIEAFLAGADPQREIFDAGDRLDYYRNGDVLRMFGDREQMGADLAIERFADGAQGGYSAAFNALRAGELMNWSVRHGLVQRVDGPAWHLTVGERQFELVGSEMKQRAVRVRGLPGAEAVVAAKIWDRELKRRERARVKRITGMIAETRRQIGVIGKYEPALKLGEGLTQFAVGDVDTVVEAAEYILDSMLPLTVSEVAAIATGVHRLYLDVCGRQTEIRTAERKRLDAEAMAASLAELAAFRLANPPPPPRVRTADVEWQPRTEARANHYCTITGTTREGVEKEAEHLRHVYYGYSMDVEKAVEIEAGVWVAKGSRWDSCD